MSLPLKIASSFRNLMKNYLLLLRSCDHKADRQVKKETPSSYLILLVCISSPLFMMWGSPYRYTSQFYMDFFFFDQSRYHDNSDQGRQQALWWAPPGVASSIINHYRIELLSPLTYCAIFPIKLTPTLSKLNTRGKRSRCVHFTRSALLMTYLGQPQ